MESRSSNKDKKVVCNIHLTNKEKIKYLCLHPLCHKNRLFCDRCYKDIDHRRHSIAFINTSIQPFSRLCLNAFDANSKIHSEILNKKLYNIRQIINTSQEKLVSFFEQIKVSFLEPLEAIAGTYTTEMVDFVMKSIHNEPTNTRLMNQIAQKINILLGIQQNQYQNDVQRFTAIEQCSIQIIAEMNSKVKLAIETMKYELNEISVVNSFKNKDFKLQKKIPSFSMNKSVEDLKGLSFADDQLRSLNKLENTIASDMRNMLQQSRSMQKKNQSQKMEQEFPEPRKKVISTRKQKKERVVKGDQPSEKRKNKRSPLNNASNMENQTSVMRNESIPQQESQDIHASQHAYPKDSSSLQQNKEDSNLSINSWTISSQKSIAQLPKSCYKKILTLEVFKLYPQQPTNFFNILKKMVNLQQISIFDHLICQQNKITELMQSLPKSIKHIYLNCSNQFSRKCISIIQKRKLTEIIRLEYYYDIQRSLKRLDQSLYFREIQKGVRVQPLDNLDTFNLIQKLPNLKNLWVKAKSFKLSSRKKMKFHNLSSLIIGQLQPENQQQDIDPITERLCESLKYTNNLKCLVLFTLKIQPQIFISVIKANQQLQTLAMERCVGITEQTMKIVATPVSQNSVAKIKNFSIKQCPQITGAFVQSIPYTQIFIHNFRQNTNQEINIHHNPYTSFQKCDSLIYFNVYGNPFFDDKLFSTFKNSFSKLRSVNIGHTRVTDASVQIFKHIPEIDCLCLDQNRLTQESMLKICSYLPKIQRLSLCGFNGEKGKFQMSSALLNEIGLKLPLLRHLELRSCGRMNEEIDFLKLPKLKIVELDKGVGESFISVLKSSGITVFDDSDV